MQPPLLVQLFEKLPGPFAARALLFYLLCMLPVVAGSFLFGELSPRGTLHTDDAFGMLTMSFLMTILLVYAVAAYAALLQRAGGKIAGSRTTDIIIGLVGVTLSLIAPLLEAGEENWNPYDASRWYFESGHHRILTPIIGWHMARATYAMGAEAANISNRIDGLKNFDLFDPVPLQAPVRQGLLNVAIVAGFAAMLTPFLIDPRYYSMVSFVVPITLFFASIGFIIPARGVARRIRQEKETALTQLAPEIAIRRKALAGLKEGAPDWPQMAGQLESLIAYRNRIAAVREWPFDRSAFSRLGLYMLIPVASWIGAALVEQIVESVL